jgi:hypothetical protein
MTATGFYRLGTWDDEPADRPLARYDVLDHIVSTTSSVVLGMSVGCARCHDHKKDPILAKDYYSLLAFFQDVSDMNARNLRVVADGDAKLARDKAAAEKQAREADLYRQAYAIEQRFLAAARARGSTPASWPAAIWPTCRTSSTATRGRPCPTSRTSSTRTPARWPRTSCRSPRPPGTRRSGWCSTAS